MSYTNLIINKIADNKKYHFWIFLAVLIFLSVVMIFSYKLYPSHDFYFHYKRLNVLIDALQNGNFPIYLDYTAANGYGYATKWFYSDFILIPFAAVGILTNSIFAYQFMWFSMTILCGIFMYNTVNKIYKSSYAAAISSILFTFCTYRLLDMYNRSAVGEALSFTFVPIIFLGLYEIIKGDYRKWYILAIGYSLMIFTHVLSSFLMFITLLIVLGVYYKDFLNERKRIYYLILSGIVTIFVVAYYLFPMIEQMVSGSFYYQTVVKAHPNDHKQGLNWIIWGMFGGVVHPKQIFIPGIGILLTWAVSLRLFVKEKRTALLKSIDTGVIIGFVFIVLASFIIPWNVFPFSKLFFIQLPWRLYEFVSYFFAIAGGYYLVLILKSNRRLFWAAIMIIVATTFVITSSGRDFQFENSEKDINQIATKENNNFHLYGMEYVPSKVPSIEYIDERGDSIKTKYEETTVTNFNKNKGITSFTINTDKEELIELPLFYYKGYEAKLDNEDIPITESNNGLVEISANKSGNISVYYGGTNIQKTSPYISILSVLSLCVYIFVTKRKKKQ